MARQERTARATKRAAAQAATIIEEAYQGHGHPKAIKRCPVCGARGTVVELRAGGQGRNCEEAESEAVPCAECGRPVHIDEDGYAQDDATGQPSGVEHECNPEDHDSEPEAPTDAATCKRMREEGKS